MNEITYDGKEALETMKRERKVYRDGEYDFTFEGRFLVYHFRQLDILHYIAVDTEKGGEDEKYGRASEIVSVNEKDCYKVETYESMIPALLYAIKYTGDGRYLSTNLYKF